MDARQHIIREAIEEQRQIFGMENPDKQWILSSWDTWERNPFYHGPEQHHPEDDDGHADECEMLPPPPAVIYVPSEKDDCPF